MGRHRYTACVRSDGLLATVGPRLDRRRVVAATLVDISSGFLLDGYSHDPALSDLELLGAAHADLARTAAVLAAATPDTGGDDEFVVSRDGRYHHVLRPVVDPHDDLLALSAVVRGTHRHAVRVRRHLRAVSVAGLTAGPGADRRLFAESSTPGWDAAVPLPATAAQDRDAAPTTQLPIVPPRTAAASPPSAMAPFLPPGQVQPR